MDYFLFFILTIWPMLFIVISTLNNAWTPFQSDLVKEIKSNISSDEIKMSVRRAFSFNFLCILIVSAGLIGISKEICNGIIKWIFSVESNLLVTFLSLPGIWLMMGLLYWKILKPYLDKSQKEFLATTQWAKDQELSPIDIVLYRH